MAQLNVGGNFLAGLSGGLQAGQGIRQMQDANKLRTIMQESGGNMLDPQVISQVAAIDPNMGMNLSNQAYRRERNAAADRRAEQRFSQTTELNAARLEQIKAESARAAAAEARRLTAEQKAAEAQKIDSALASASAAYQQGPEAFTAWTQANAGAIQESGLDPAQITYDSFPMVAAGLVGARDGLTAGSDFAQGLQPEAPDLIEMNGQLVDRSAPGGPTVVPIQNMPPEAPGFEDVQSLRKEFTGIPAVKAFSEQAQAYGRIVSSAKDPSPAGDLALVFNFMKVLDPGSVVRESEFATAEQAAAWLQQSEQLGVQVPRPVASAIRKMQTGERLSNEQRRDFVARGQSLYQGAEQQYDNLRGQYTSIAEANNFPVDQALPDFRYSGDDLEITSPEQTSGVPTFNFENDEQRSVFEKYSQGSTGG